MTSGEERDPGLPAAAEPPLYGVEGWPGQREVTAAGVRGRGADVTLISVAVAHRCGGASITVTSHRLQDSGMVALRRRASRDTAGGARRELTWADVAIPVDGHPASFQLCEVREGWWVAVGRAAEAGLTLDSRGVPLAGLRLARVTDLPVPKPRLHIERPETPTREFPTDSGAAGSIPGHARLDLTYERFRLLTGSAGGLPVRLDLNVPAHSGAAGDLCRHRREPHVREDPRHRGRHSDPHRRDPDPPGRETTRLTGSYEGPPALLALTVGALLHFI